MTNLTPEGWRLVLLTGETILRGGRRGDGVGCDDVEVEVEKDRNGGRCGGWFCLDTG